jgi:MFS family permease
MRSTSPRRGRRSLPGAATGGDALKVLKRLQAMAPMLVREIWIVQGATFVTWLGNGAVAPFVLVYLHEVRGFPLGTAGLVVAATGAGALGAGPLAGSLADRVGPRTVLRMSLLCGALTWALLPAAREPWEAAVLLALAGAAGAAFGTSQSTLVAALTEPGRRRGAFALQRVSIHLGLGLGALGGGILVSVAHPSTFTMLFRLNALSFLLSAALLLAVSKTRPPPEVARAGYHDVVRDRAFVGFLLVNSLVIAGAIVPMGTFLPVLALDAGASEAQVGQLLLLGSFVVVVAQLPIAGVLAGRRRMGVLALMAALWSSALLTVSFTGFSGRATALALLAVAIVLFAIGQCLHGAVQNPLTADLGDGRAPGRYMGMLNLSWQVSLAVGPALGGFVVAAKPYALWPLGAFVCLLAGGLALGLDLAPSSPLRRGRAAEAVA